MGYLWISIPWNGRVKLLVTLGAEPLSAIQVEEFIVVNEDISYNAIVGRPLLKEMRVITFICHLSLKFPTPNGIGCMQGCQRDSRECHVKALRTAEQTYKHVLLVDGGPLLESCNKYVGTPKEEGERQERHKSTRSTCNMIIIV